MLDFKKPMFAGQNKTPVYYICADVVQINSARVCVDPQTGIVYSSPYIGMQVYNEEIVND